MNNKNTIIIIGLIVLVFLGFLFVENNQRAQIQENVVVDTNDVITEDVKDWTESDIKKYIEENLNDFNPVEGVLGGTMYVLDINLLDNNTFEVYQEDGHIENFFSGEYTIEEDGLNIFNIQNLGSDYYEQFIANS